MKNAGLFTGIGSILIALASTTLMGGEMPSVTTPNMPPATAPLQPASSTPVPQIGNASPVSQEQPAAEASARNPENTSAGAQPSTQTTSETAQVPTPVLEQASTPQPEPKVKETAPIQQPAVSEQPQLVTPAVEQIPVPPTLTQPVSTELKDAPIPAEPKKSAIEEGIDTLDQEGGNWLRKRQALEKTIDTLERIKNLFNNILKSRIDFMVKRNKIDREFDLFANTVGFEFGDLSQQLESMQQSLEKERKDEGELSEQEREALAELDKKITELTELIAQLKKITDLDGLK